MITLKQMREIVTAMEGELDVDTEIGILGYEHGRTAFIACSPVTKPVYVQYRIDGTFLKQTLEFDERGAAFPVSA